MVGLTEGSHEVPSCPGLVSPRPKDDTTSNSAPLVRILWFFGFHPNYFSCRTSCLLVLMKHLYSPSQKHCFFLLVTAFAIQVHRSVFHCIRHENDFRHFRFPFWLQPPLAIFQLSCLFPVRPVRQISWWCPSDSLQPFRFFFLIWVHPQVMLFLHCLQGFFCLCAFQFFNFFNDLILQSFTRSVLHSELAFDRILENFVFCSAFVFHGLCLDTLFPSRLSISTALPSGPAGHK